MINAADDPMRLPKPLRRRFDLLMFDWDGTAVPDRQTPVPELDAALAKLLSLGVWVAPVTGTNVDNLERQSLAHIDPGVRRRLVVCTNRGSEVFKYGSSGERELVVRRQATEAEERALTAAAEDLQRRLGERGLTTAIVYKRLNRRKVDLIPLDEWRDPPKARIGELIAATTARIAAAGFSDIGEIMVLAVEVAKEAGIDDPRVTSDGKYVEIGLTDKSDSINWLLEHVARPKGIPDERILIGGDEFGNIDGFPGSDERMFTGSAAGATFVSVGREPHGVPEGVLHVPGGPATFLEILRWQSTLPR